MKSRTLIILVLLGLAAVAVTTLLERERGPSGDDITGQRLLPELEAVLNDITELRISAGGDDGDATVRRGETDWVVVEKSGYRADSGKIRQLLIRLAEARVLERKTANPELYDRLGVGDVGSEGGGIQLVMEGPPEPVSLIVGNRERRAGKGTYVRLAGAEQSYLVDAELEPAKSAVGWIDRDLVDVPPGDVSAITVTHGDGSVLRVERGDSGLAVVDVPAGRELSSTTTPQSMARALTTLRLDDVMAAEAFGEEPAEAVTEYRLGDGRRLTARLWQRDDSRYLALRAAYEPPIAAPDEAETDAPAEVEGETDEAAAEPARENAEAETAGTETVEAAEPERGQLAAETSALDDRLRPWVFRIPTSKHELMVRRMDDLLAAEAEAEAED